MNIPDINSANKSLNTDPLTANAVSQPNISHVQPQQPERNDEYVRQARKAQDRTSTREIQASANEEQPDRFIQSPTAGSAVYNVKDISRSRRNNSDTRLDEENKVLDVILPMGRKRLRIFVEEQ